jgi:large subunit ribosomal protein L46
MGDETASLEAQREALVRDAEGRLIPGAEPAGDKEANKEQVSGDAKVGEGQRKDLELHVERPASRVTEADVKNDTLSLNRKLDQTLYLLVQNKEGLWRFPEDRLFAREDLHMVSFSRYPNSMLYCIKTNTFLPRPPSASSSNPPAST